MEEEKSWRRNGGQEMLREDGIPEANCFWGSVALTTDFSRAADVVEKWRERRGEERKSWKEKIFGGRWSSCSELLRGNGGTYDKFSGTGGCG
jgi:hypothetical protein